MKSKFKGRVPRTSGWESQTYFDNEISHMDVSSLKFLKSKYNKDIKEFPLHFDMNSEENLALFKEMLQRKKMIDEELIARSIYDISARDEFYDSSEEIVLDKDGNTLYNISLSEDESEYNYHHLTGGKVVGAIDKDQDEDDIQILPVKIGAKIVEIRVLDKRTLEEIYKDWDYTEEIHEEASW